VKKAAKAPAKAPAEAKAQEEAAPIPPAPAADPSARIAQPRKVVSASFVR
jgi:hypothetical protein